MFDLEQSIKEWRRQMLAAGVKTPVPLEELECHLREDVEQQAKSGLSEAEAFTGAVQKIGEAQAVKKEFEKVEQTAKARPRKFMDVFMMGFAIIFPLWVGDSVYFKTGGFSQATASERNSALVAVALFALLLWGGRLGYKLLPVIRLKRTRDVLFGASYASIIIWCVVFLNLIVPRYEFTCDQFTTAILWGLLTPAGLALGLCWGREAARVTIGEPIKKA
jgi:hypothetical protein